jgi:hypothetical protein
MCWIYTRGITALMQNKAITWDFSNEQLESYTMSLHQTITSSWANLHDTVAVFLSATRPKPTFVLILTANMRHEPIP